MTDSINAGTGKIGGVLAEFNTPQELLKAAERVRSAGYTKWDTHTPFPVHGMDDAMDIKPTILPWLVLGGGLTGFFAGIALQWWTNAVDYPHIVSGKPFFSLPANIPIAFELTILFAALTAVFGMFALNKLPEFWHSVFTSSRFKRATNDKFFISIEANDPKFDLKATTQFLTSLGSAHVEELDIPGDIWDKIPNSVVIAALLIVLVGLIPGALLLEARFSKSDKPRPHVIPNMDKQPRYTAQQPNPMFNDGRADRQPVPGTVAWGELKAEDHYYRGIQDGQWLQELPMKLTEEILFRGQERFGIYCSACHGLAGYGDGIMATKPGMIPPSSFHTELVRSREDGHIFNTITNGIRNMSGYGAQISVADRWAIVAYVRALQRSQNATLDDVPREKRRSVQ